MVQEPESIVDEGPSETPPSASFIRRLAGLFASPGRTFDIIAARPACLAPLAASLLFLAAFWTTVYARFGEGGMAAYALQNLGRPTQVNQNAIDNMLQLSSHLTLLVLMASVVILLLHLLVIARLGMGIISVVTGTKARFRSAFSVVAYAYLARTVVETVLSIPIVLWGDSQGLNFRTLLPTNIAFFLDPSDTSAVLYAVLRGFDIIQIWYLILIGIGLSKAARDEDIAPVTVVVLLVLWITWNVLLAGFKLG